MKKLVFVTGAGRGIGRAIALHLASQGYTVSGCARSSAELEAVAAESGGHIRAAMAVMWCFQVANNCLFPAPKRTNCSIG